MGDPRTSSADDHDAASRGIRTVMAAIDNLSPDELAAIRALAEVPATAPDVAGFEMTEHERWGALRDGATGDLYSVIAAYKQLEGSGPFAAAPAASTGSRRLDPEPAEPSPAP